VTSAVDMRLWYVPIEIITLRRWLVAAFVVNIMLLTVDVLRADSKLLILGVLSCLLFAALRASLPEINDTFRRNVCLVLSSSLLGLSAYRLLIAEPTVFNFWIHCWSLVPSGLALYWLSGRPVTVWTARKLSDSAFEYGLLRNAKLGGRLEAIGAHITLVHFVAISVIPLIWVIDIAFSEGNSLGGQIGDSFTTEHFEKILNGESFGMWFRNSLIVSIGTALVALFIAIPAGYAFSRYKFTGRDASMFSFLLVQMFPGIIILVPYFLVMKTLGLLNSHLGLILAYCVTALPLCVWMLKGFFDTIPRELEEAAVLDGCNQVQVFTKVVLPLSTPAIAVTALFSFLAAWNEFLLALTFNTSNDMYTLPVGLASLISSTSQSWGDFAAASLLVSLPVALLFLFFQKFLIDGLSAGGVKG